MATSPRRLAGLVFMLVLLASNLNLSIQDCNSSGSLQGQSGNCNTENNAECCRSDQTYPQFECSPPVTEETQATMTLNSFEDNGDGGGKSKCDETYHSNSELIVALSTGWFNDNNNRRCNQKIRINANDKSVLAEVVDECDSVNGCDKEHDFQPPCHNNIVDASQAVWDALEIYGSQVGKFDITWSDV